MKTNDIKKGHVVRLRNGWYGIMADNMKGNTRLVDVDGMFREMGSVYSHDITIAWPDEKFPLGSQIRLHGAMHMVTHTDSQLKLKEVT